ncbi:MAG: hypothetical protein ACRYGB_07740 [Janthinobacterium lividum]
MNQTFSIKRFSMLSKKHLAENYKTYLMSAGVMLGLLLIVFGISSYGNNGVLQINMQSSNFTIFMLMGGSIFTSLIFADLGNKKEAIPALTLPASSFEKFLVNWIVSFLIFQIVFIVIFYFVAVVVISFGKRIPGQQNTLLNVFSDDTKAWYTFIIYIVLQSVTFFGAIYFEKLHFVKTAFAFFIGVFLLGILNKPIITSMFSRNVMGTTIFSPISITEKDKAFTIHANDIKNYQEGIVLGLVVLILWISAYYRLKEKEV